MPKSININPSGIDITQMLSNPKPIEDLSDDIKAPAIKRVSKTKIKKRLKDLEKAHQSSKTSVISKKSSTDSKAPSSKNNKKEISAERQMLILKIQKYQNSPRFGDYVRKQLKINFNNDQINKKSIKQLENTLSKIRVNLDNRNVDKIMDSMVTHGLLVLEKGGKTIGFNIDGTASSLMDSDDFLNAFERFKIDECGVIPKMPLKLQLLYMISSTMMVQYHINQQIVKSDKPEPLGPAQMEMQGPQMLDDAPDEVKQIISAGMRI